MLIPRVSTYKSNLIDLCISNSYTIPTRAVWDLLPEVGHDHMCTKVGVLPLATYIANTIKKKPKSRSKALETVLNVKVC